MRSKFSLLARRLLSPDFLIMAALFIFAFTLRVQGISGSLPYVGHPDEPKIIDSAIHIVKTGDLNPHLYIWPSLYVYLQALLLKLHVLYGTWRGYYAGPQSLPDVTHIFTQDTGVYLWARLLAAFIGAVTIPVLYTVGKAMFNGSRRVGVAAALMLAVSPLHVQYSQFALTDAPLGLVGLLVLWASYRLSRTDSGGGAVLRDPLFWAAALSGLLVGVATGTKYNGLYLGLVAAIAWVMSWRRNRFNKPHRNRLLASLAAIPLFAALGFLLSEPYALLDWPAFSQGLAFQVRAYLPADNLDQVAASIQRHITDLAESDMYFFMPAFLGAFAVLANPPVRNRAWLLLIFPIFYLLAMSRFSLTYVRNLIVTLPFLALLSGYVIDLVAMQLTSLVRGYRSQVHSRRVWGAVRWIMIAAALGLVIWEPLRVSRNYSASMADPDSRNLAWTWMQSQMQAGARFAAELHPYQVQDWPDVLAYDVENPGDLRPLTTRPPQWYAQRGYGYVVLNSNFKDKQRDPGIWPAYQQLRVVKRFLGDKEGGKGPTITVLATGQVGELVPAMYRKAARLEDFGTLVAYDLAPITNTDVLLDPTAAPPTGSYKIGQAVGLNLYYRALRDGRPTDPAWQVWVHLVDPATGNSVAQVDVPPLSGQWKQYPGITRQPHPVKDWKQGELLGGIYNFALPANLKPGKYRLETGMWVPPNGPGAQVSYGPGDKPAPGTSPDRVVLDVELEITI